MEDLLLPCALIFVLFIAAIGIFLLLNRRPFRYEKRKEGQNICLSVTAKKNLDRVVVTARFDGEEISFERKRIRKGQCVDFVFPASEKKIKLLVAAESGSAQEFEV
jgi:hypothetical protein